MDASNLAVVLAPAFFPVEDIRKNVADQDQMKQRIGVIEALINLSEDVRAVSVTIFTEFACNICFSYSCQVGYLTKAVADEYTELHIASSLVPEDLPSLDTLGLPNNDADAASANHGPSARRVKKKKRRSGSLSRMFSATVKSIHGITRVISRSATPVAPRRTTWVADDELDFEHSVHETPLAVSKQSTFVSPQVVQPRKRKARRESELSPKTKKQQRADAKSEIATPKAGRGFSIKRKFKEKQRKSFRETTAAAPNAQLEKASALSHNFSPSKPSLLLHSPPPTPANLGIPRQATDIVTPENSKENETSSQVGRQKDFSDADIDEVNVSATSQRTAGDDSSNLSVSSNSTFKSSNDSTGRCNYRPRSPSVEGHMRKIGAARSRSVKTAGAETKPSLCNLPAKNLRSQLRRGMAGHTPAKISSNRPTPLKAPPRPSSHEKSLVNLRQDISSFIEKSFGYNEFDNDVSGIRALDTTDNVDPASLYGNMRRQSSAFEFSRTAGSYLSAASAAVAPLRRQSSAFEVAARNRLTHKPSMAAYECLNRVGTRSSLRRKNSSVRDLVERLEKKSTFERNTSTSSVISSSSSFTKDQESEDDKKTDDFTKLDDDEWVNGVDFFKNKDRRLASIEMEESGSGCKRSSILRIRKENKGKVSQSVENFTRPVMAPPPTPARRTNQQHDVPSNSHTKSLSLRRQTAHHEGAVKHHAMPTPTNSRRNSARMGVATTPSALTPLQPRNPKRTGIRTSVNHKYAALTSSTPERNLTDRKAPDVKKTNVEVEKHRTVRTSDVPKKQSHQKATATRSNKKNSGERRHLTIGYPGEVRSPLKDRQNMVATVQRSKSAQAPLLSKPKRKSSIQKQQQPENCHCMVTRSQSTRSPSITPAKLAPGSSVRRNKSERSNTKNTPKRYQFQQADRLTPSGRNSRIK